MRKINPYRMFKGAFIPNALMEWGGVSQSAKLMWARLAQYAGADGRCYPRIERLGVDISLSRSGAKKAIKELRDAGLILVKHAEGRGRVMHKTSEYYFLDHEIFKLGNSAGGSENGPSGGSENGPSGGSENGPSMEGPKMDPPIEENQLRESERKCPVEKTDQDDGSFSPPKKFHGSDDDHRFARKMYEAVIVVNATVKEPNWDRWANTLRLMREQDGRTHADMWRVFDFANRDQFWGHNVLSPEALRRHYTKLAPKAGMVRSRVRGSEVVVKPGKTCGTCEFFGKGKKLCAGKDEIVDSPACELYRKGGDNE